MPETLAHNLSEETQRRLTGEIRRARELLELPVYSVAEGKDVGVVDALLVRRNALSIAWVRLWLGTLHGHWYVPFSAFQTVGVDVALVPSVEALHKQVPDEERGSLDTALSGRSVMTQGGKHIGSLVGYEADTATGDIVALRIRPNADFLHHLLAVVRDNTLSIPASHIASLGPDAVILEPDAASLFQPDHGKPPAVKEPAK